MPPVAPLRSMRPSDASEVLRIYAQGIAGGQSTFEHLVPDWTAFDTARLPTPRIVAPATASSTPPMLLGWAVLSAVSQRPAYAGVAETTVYVDDAAQGQGVGTRLMEGLIEAAEAEGFWMLQAVVFPENKATLALHHKMGFRTVGRRERIGLAQCGPMAGQWRDTLLLERRSQVVHRASTTTE